LKTILFFLSIIICPDVALANDEIWLQDTKCILVKSDGFKIESIIGGLVSYICSKKGMLITCSTTSNSGSMHDGKPSTITTYDEGIAGDFALWMATSHDGIVILDLKNKRYSVNSRHLLKEGLIIKNCIGEIKKY